MNASDREKMDNEVSNRLMKLVINSGATSNFVPEEMNLPKKGKSNKEVYLPDNNTKLQATH